MKHTLLLILLLAILFNSSCNSNSSSNNYSTPDNGDLNETFTEKKELTPEEQYQQEKQKLISDGWEESGIENGLMPSCYNFTPKYDKSIDNYLEINVGGGTDVAIKLMNLNSEKCVRYVFVNSGSSYQIRNVPQGEYYLKIAYGKEWLSKIESNQCIGKFIRNPLYEKGEDKMDFSIQNTYDGYNVPSFRLSLDVVSTNLMNSFSSHNISESDFNN